MGSGHKAVDAQEEVNGREEVSARVQESEDQDRSA